MRLCVIEVRTKLLSPFQMIMPVFCQPPLYLTVNSVSAVQLVPSAARSWPMKFTGPSDVAAALRVELEVGRRHVQAAARRT